MPFCSAVPFKYEKIKEPSVDKPGLIRVYTINTLEDGSKQEVSEDFNTVSATAKRYFSILLGSLMSEQKWYHTYSHLAVLKSEAR